MVCLVCLVCLEIHDESLAPVIFPAPRFSA